MRKRTIAVSAAAIALLGPLLPVSVQAAPKAINYYNEVKTVKTPADSYATLGKAQCPAGWSVVSGGYTNLPASQTTETTVDLFTVTASYPSSNSSWTVSAMEWRGEKVEGDHWFYKPYPRYLQVYARCTR